MSEITPEAPVETDEPVSTESATDDTDWKEQARKWENRSKKNLAEKTSLEEAARKWQEYQEAQKSEAEKTAERLAAVEAEAVSARTELLRYRVAAAKGIPENALKFLNGSTEEELTASAEDILSLIGTAGTKPAVAPIKTQGNPQDANVSTGDVLEDIRRANS
jgi:flagellar biosynthesis GTPase FlhF